MQTKSPCLSDSQNQLSAMRSLLYYNVPRFIECIESRGGVSHEEWRWLQCDDGLESACLQFILDRADECLLYPKNYETFQQSLFLLVKALAIMSFVPGGIRIFDLHFCSKLENFVVVEDG